MSQRELEERDLEGLDTTSYAGRLLLKTLEELAAQKKALEDKKVAALFHSNSKNVLFSLMFGHDDSPEVEGIKFKAIAFSQSVNR